MVELACKSGGLMRFATADGGSVDVRRCHLEFQPYAERIEFDAGSYTNKSLVELDGQPLFGELAILRLAEKDGWEGVWLDTYHGGKKWRDMPHISDPVSIPEERQGLLDRIRERHGKRGGAWDVFVWKGDGVAFLESKRSSDSVRPNQRSWLSAALAEGLAPATFTMVEWTTTGTSALAKPRRQGQRRETTKAKTQQPQQSKAPADEGGLRSGSPRSLPAEAREDEFQSGNGQHPASGPGGHQDARLSP